MPMRDHTITIPLGEELKRWVEGQARLEHRSTAGQVRHWIEEQRVQHGHVALAPVGISQDEPTIDEQAADPFAGE